MAPLVATSYPLFDAFLTMLWFMGFVLWIWLVIAVFTDIFRSHDMSGWGKAAWIFAAFLLPLVGVLAYLIVRGGKMRTHAMEDMQEQEKMTRQYIKTVAGETGTADELAKLAGLHDQGVLSDEEFEAQKARLLSAA